MIGAIGDFGSGLQTPAVGGGLVDSGATIGDQRSFEQALGIARGKLGGTEEQNAREAAEMMVAATFYEPMLKSLRDSDWAAEPFKPTQGEKQFRALMDRQMAHNMVKSARLPIVDALTRDLLAAAGGGGDA